MPPAIKLSQDLLPLTDLKTHASEVVRQVNETGRPMVVTRHGRGVAVLISLEEYEALEEAAEVGALRQAVREAEDDINLGKTTSIEQERKRWTERFTR